MERRRRDERGGTSPWWELTLGVTDLRAKVICLENELDYSIEESQRRAIAVLRRILASAQAIERLCLRLLRKLEAGPVSGAAGRAYPTRR